MIVYRVANPTSYTIPAVFRDQFSEYDLLLHENLFLCVPALKDDWYYGDPGPDGG